MPPVSRKQVSKHRGITLPGWVIRRRSGLLIVGDDFPQTLSEKDLAKLIVRNVDRNRGDAGEGPTIIQVAAQTEDELSRPKSALWTSTPARIIDLLRRSDIDLSGVRCVVTRLPSHDRLAFSADIGFIMSKFEKPPQVVLICDSPPSVEVMERIPVNLRRIEDLRNNAMVQQKGSDTMARSDEQYIKDYEELEEKVADIVRRIHEDEDPHEMNEYKRFIKKHVSVFSRAYFTAYLVKQFVDGNTERRPRKSSTRKDEPTVGNVAPEDRQTLFVSVGKNRRVYPKDFVALFAELDGVEGDDIGQIKILDNYSFIEVEETVADKIIAAYDGYDFRGRKLTVNYARNKKD